MYRTLFDMSIEARILCALSCCIGFFGAVAIYFYLLVLHHYNRELFFDNDLTLIKVFSRTRKFKKNFSKEDPEYKKKTIRTEIELSSKNEIFKNGN